MGRGVGTLAPAAGGSVSRALGAAAAAAGAVLVLHYLVAALNLTLGGWGDPAGAAALVLAARFGAPALTPVLGGRAPVRAPWAAGALAGAAAALALALLLWLSGGARWHGFPAAPWTAVAGGCALAAALGYAEECFLRGTAFAVLQTRAGTAAAVWGAAALLALVRLLSGMGPVTGLTTLALGVWWGRARARLGGSGHSAAAHAAWAAILGPVLGLGGEVAGGQGRSLLVARAGPAWWAGPPGAVEGGLAALILACAAALASGLWTARRDPHVRRGRSDKGSPHEQRKTG